MNTQVMNTQQRDRRAASGALAQAGADTVALTLTAALISRLPIPPAPDEATDLAVCLYHRLVCELAKTVEVSHQ